MIEEMKALARSKTICVLATIAGEKPYCSLMAYATNEDCTEIYMATQRSTRKFRNLTQNPAVSLMIDTRDAVPRSQAQALTVEGTCSLIEDHSKKQRVQSKLRATHPHLEEFLDQPGNVILCVRIQSLLLLKGLTEAHRATLE